MLPQKESAKCQAQNAKYKLYKSLQFNGFLPLICCLLVVFAACFASCRTAPTDMRTLAPTESLIYLETEDLGEMLESLTKNKNFIENIATKTDFSPLKNTQTAIVVTGIEASEKQLADNSAILNFKPQFVLIADTHSWERTNISLVENQLNVFIKRIYGDSLQLEKTEKSGVKFYIWTAENSKKIYAAIDGSLIYIGNNESAIDKCLAVKSGEAENLSKNESLSQARERGGEKKLAFGYVSSEGIAQIANLAGVTVAVDAAEEDLTKSFIAKILPEILQKTVREISWTAQKNERGIEDKIYLKIDGQISDVWKETLLPDAADQFQAAQFIPANFETVTRYNLQNPQIAWRSILLALAGKLDTLDGKVWMTASGSFFAPYGIADAEIFLSAVKTEITTFRLNSESIAIAEVKDGAKLKSAIIKEINFSAPPEKIGAAEIWKSSEDEQSVAFIDGKVLLGSRSDILNCLKAKESGLNFTKTQQYQFLVKTNALSVTTTKDTETMRKIGGVFGSENNKNSPVFYITETRFNTNGIERRTNSDFGLIGTILENFNSFERR